MQCHWQLTEIEEGGTVCLRCLKSQSLARQNVPLLLPLDKVRRMRLTSAVKEYYRSGTMATLEVYFLPLFQKCNGILRQTLLFASLP